MATAKKTSNKKDVTKGQGQDMVPADLDMSQYAGAGLENTDRESFAIPFLAIAQKMSPQVDKDTDQYVEGLEVGDLFLTATNEIFKDEDGVDIVFCGFRRVFLRWAPRDDGGGFKGELAPNVVSAMRANGEVQEVDGKLFADDGDLIRDTRIHYVMVLRDDGSYTPAVVSMASTQIKKSKMLLTQLKTYVAKGPKGNFTPPTFAHVFHCETVAEQNDQGSWRGWKFTRKGWTPSKQLLADCDAFSKQIAADNVKVDHAAESGGGSSSDTEGSGDGF